MGELDGSGSDGEDSSGLTWHGGLHGGSARDVAEATGGKPIEPVKRADGSRRVSYNGMMRVDLAAAFAPPKLTAVEAAMQVRG